MDKKKWIKDMSTKSSLNTYKAHKKDIKQENKYDNRLSSKIWFGGRTNTIELNYENRHRTGKSTICDLCEKEDETTIHFILDCEVLNDKRDKNIIEKYKQQNKEDTIGKILFSNNDTEKIKNMLESMWRKRTRLKKEKNKRER